MRAFLALTLFLALLAGCSGSPAEDPAQALAPSDSDSAGATAGSASAPAAAPAPVATVREPVWLAGRTQAGACAGAGGLAAYCQGALGQGTFVMLGSGSDLLGLTGNLTWAAATPATQELFVMVLGCADMEGSECRNHGELPYAFGPSPLAVDWDLAGMDEQPLALWVVHYLGQGAAGSYVTGMAPQDFAFDGMLESQA